MKQMYFAPTAERVNLSEKSSILIGSIPVKENGPVVTDPKDVLTSHQDIEWADSDE